MNIDPELQTFAVELYDLVQASDLFSKKLTGASILLDNVKEGDGVALKAAEAVVFSLMNEYADINAKLQGLLSV